MCIRREILNSHLEFASFLQNSPKKIHMCTVTPKQSRQYRVLTRLFRSHPYWTLQELFHAIITSKVVALCTLTFLLVDNTVGIVTFL